MCFRRRRGIISRVKPIQLTSAQKKQLREEGYVHLPGAVPRPLVDSARRAINATLSGGYPARMPADPVPEDTYKAMQALGPTPVINDLIARTALQGLAESLLGGVDWDCKPTGWIVLRYPQMERLAETPNFHVDGVYMRDEEFEDGAPNRIAPNELCTNTLKIGVYLSDVPRTDCGNFTVLQGSHLRLAKHLKKHGWEVLKKGLPKIDLGKPKQIVGRAGDAILCHYMLAHEGEQNLSPDIRYAVFFNLAQKEHKSRWQAALTDPWLEWPGLKSR